MPEGTQHIVRSDRRKTHKTINTWKCCGACNELTWSYSEVIVWLHNDYTIPDRLVHDTRWEHWFRHFLRPYRCYWDRCRCCSWPPDWMVLLVTWNWTVPQSMWKMRMVARSAMVPTMHANQMMSLNVLAAVLSLFAPLFCDCYAHDWFPLPVRFVSLYCYCCCCWRRCNCVSATHYVTTNLFLPSKMLNWNRPSCANRSYCLTIYANATTIFDSMHYFCCADAGTNLFLLLPIDDWWPMSELNPFSAHNQAAEHCSLGNLRVPVRPHCSVSDYFSLDNSPNHLNNFPCTNLLDHCRLSVCLRICCNCRSANCTNSSLVVVHTFRNRNRLWSTQERAPSMHLQNFHQSFQNLNSMSAMLLLCRHQSLDCYACHCYCSVDSLATTSFLVHCARNFSVYFGCSWTEYSMDYKMESHDPNWLRARQLFAFRMSRTAEIDQRRMKKYFGYTSLPIAEGEESPYSPISYWQLSCRPKYSMPIQCDRILCPVPSQSPIYLRRCQQNSIHHSHWT